MCTVPQTCAGGGTANVCGCTPEGDPAFCTSLSKNCGQVTGTDNCGQPRTVSSCGMCTVPQTCAGGGTANVCGCKPESDPAFCTRLVKNCGQVIDTDNCGQPRMVASCGTCASPQTCGGAGTANVCGVACSTPYAQPNCFSFQQGDQVSSGGHNWTCANGNCRNCAGDARCSPGGSGCPWGAVWTDLGPCG
jgi:hypothetical protein